MMEERRNATISFRWAEAKRRYPALLDLCGSGVCCRQILGSHGARCPSRRSTAMNALAQRSRRVARFIGLAALAALTLAAPARAAEYPSRPVTLVVAVSYTHLRAHETDSYLVCRL